MAISVFNENKYRSWPNTLTWNTHIFLSYTSIIQNCVPKTATTAKNGYILPQHVVRIIDAAVKDHYLMSWRIYGDENVQVTLRLASHSASSTADQHGYIRDHNVQQRHYRVNH